VHSRKLTKEGIVETIFKLALATANLINYSKMSQTGDNSIFANGGGCCSIPSSCTYRLSAEADVGLAAAALLPVAGAAAAAVGLRCWRPSTRSQAGSRLYADQEVLV